MDSWGTPLRDVLANVALELGGVNPFLRAFLSCEGQPYEKPYSNIKSLVAGDERSDNRIETMKKLFEEACLIRVVDDAGTNRLHVTPLGRAVARAWDRASHTVEAELDALAEAVVPVLARYQLVNPSTKNRFGTEKSDIFPHRAIWQAMRLLDDRLHAEELNRVILRVTTQAGLPAAVDRIREARATPGYSPSDIASADTLLGPRVTTGDDAQAVRRMTPIFSMAGYDGLLFQDDGSAWRNINPRYAPLIDRELARPAVFHDYADDVDGWSASLFSAIEAPTSEVSPTDEATLTNALDLVARYGARRFILFSGVAGTGKTRMAALVAEKLTEGAPECRFEVQFHESYAYEDFVEGLQPTPTGGFTPARRIFRQANELAKSFEVGNAEKRVVLLIEEFSRAKLSNVLGELLTYVEHRDRQFRYPISGDLDHVSPNLVVIGTMNPLDRSVLDMDDALIRRTRRVEFQYREDALRVMLASNSMPNHVIEQLVAGLSRCWARLPFGHGVFSEVRTEADLYALWDEQLRHYFVNPAGLARHPANDAFRAAFPWVESGYRVPPLVTPDAGAAAAAAPPTTP